MTVHLWLTAVCSAQAGSTHRLEPGLVWQEGTLATRELV